MTDAIVDAGSKPSVTLEELAGLRFGEMTLAEIQLVRAASDGRLANCGKKGVDLSASENDPKHFVDWEQEREIRADLIRWLCADKVARGRIDQRGIFVVRARITGRLNLSFVDVPFPLRFVHCAFGQEILISFATLKQLALNGSYTRGINGRRAQIDGNLSLANGFIAKGQVNFLGAEIRGDVECKQGTFETSTENQVALNLARSKVSGTIFLVDRFLARGEVTLRGAEVGEVLDCANGRFENRHGHALRLTRIRVAGSIFLRQGFNAIGEIGLTGAMVGGELDCDRATLSSGDERRFALRASRAKIGSRVILGDGFSAEGRVDLLGTEIGGDLDCAAGTFSRPRATALAIDGAVIEGDVLLCKGQRPHTQHSEFRSDGEVSLISADISGSLRCHGGLFNHAKKAALSADDVRVQRDVFLDDGFMAKGEVRFLGAEIKGDFDTTGAKFEYGGLNMARSHVGTLRDSSESWPRQGNLEVDGFVYDRISDGPTDAKSRLNWLRLQIPAIGGASDSSFSPQPYRQLAKVLGEQGHDSEARKVLIGLENDRYRHGGLSSRARLWAFVLWATIGYGYRPIQALIYIAFFVAAGFIVFGSAYNAGEMAPSEREAYEELQKGGLPPYYETFCAAVYSFDTFVPIIDLGQRGKWVPGAVPESIVRDQHPDETTLGRLLCDATMFPQSPLLPLWFVRTFRWADIIAGWFFTSLFVAGISGLVHDN